MKHLRSIFNDDEFIKKLDNKIYYLAFKNGLYNLRKNKFEYGLKFQIEFEKKIFRALTRFNLVSDKNKKYNYNFLKSKEDRVIFTKSGKVESNDYFNVLEYLVFLKAENEQILTNNFISIGI